MGWKVTKALEEVNNYDYELYSILSKHIASLKRQITALKGELGWEEEDHKKLRTRISGSPIVNFKSNNKMFVTELHQENIQKFKDLLSDGDNYFYAVPVENKEKQV
jgi:hypothetical protein